MKLKEIFKKIGKTTMAMLFSATSIGFSQLANALDVNAASQTVTVHYPDGSGSLYSSAAINKMVNVGGYTDYPFIMTIDGKITYCVEPTVLSIPGGARGEPRAPEVTGGKTVTASFNELGLEGINISAEQKRKIIQIAAFANAQDQYDIYVNSNFTEAKGAVNRIWAAQILIWETIGYPVTPANGSLDKNVQIEIDIIKDRIAKFNAGISFDGEKVLLDGFGEEYAKTLTDTNGALSEVYGDLKESGNGVHFKRDGNNLKVWLEEGTTSGTVYLNAPWGNVADEDSAIIYQSPEHQNQFLIKAIARKQSAVHLEINTGNLTLTKEDLQTGSVSQGVAKLDKVSYEVVYKKTGEKVGTITWENGKANVLKNLQIGTYILTEKESATGYHKGIFENNKLQSSFEVEVNPGVTNTFSAKDRVSEIKINKIDEDTKQPVKGATLKLLDAETKKEVPFNNGATEWITDGNALTVKGLTVGKKYILRETKAPDGYSTAKDVTFTVDENTEIQTVTMVNRLTEIRIDKVDPAGNPVKGATLVLLDKETNRRVKFNTAEQEVDEKKQWISDGNGLTIRGLIVGHTYIVQEIHAPNGYVIADDLEFTVEDNIEVQVVKMIDEPSKPEEPKIGTQATIDGEKTIKEKGKVELVDVVSYDNLKAGQEYTIKGQLMDKKTGKALDIEGATVEKTFTPDKSKGTVEVVFSIDSSEIAGKETVVFETLYEDGKKVIAHTDLEDEGQTVRVVPDIKIGTTATIDGEHKIAPRGEVTLNDVVAYEKLTPGKTYVIEGTLMDKGMRTELVLNRETFTNSIEFTAEEANGEIVVPFTFNSDYLNGKTIVVFEKLYEVNEDGSKTEVAKHEDWKDKGQTVEIVEHELKTTATINGKHEVVPTGKMELIDVVEYKDLNVGETYTLKGTLMDKKTKEPLDIEGATAEITFTPKEASGKVEMKFVIDATKLAGKSTVVFERLFDTENSLVGTHEDIEDKDQTVKFIAEIGTKATINGQKEVEANGKMDIVDTISYKGLTPGKEYTAKGVLMVKETGKALDIEGATAQVTFKPEKSEGTIDVTFTVDTNQLVNKHIVVFEELYDEDEKVAEHKDINDQDQTVFIKPKPVVTPKTGTAIGIGSTLALASAAYVTRKKTKE